MEASWKDAVLLFSVTDQALTDGGVHIELCDGDIGKQDLVASGTIPGNITLGLICRLHSDCLERGNSSDGYDPVIDPMDPTTRNGGVAVEVRLYAKAGGEDAGVCTVNLNFRPDEEELANAAADTGYEKVLTHELPGVESESTATATLAAAAAAVAAVSEVGDERQSSLSLLAETARHIEAIEEVNCQAVQDKAAILPLPSLGTIPIYCCRSTKCL